MKKMLLAVLCFTMIAATPAPRPPDIPRAGETIEVSIVNVDVFVTDRAGNRVHALTRDDFGIFEDGKPQPITNFTEYAPQSENGRASVSGIAGPEVKPDVVPAPAPRQHRTVVVFIDRFQLQGMKVDEVFTQIRELLHKAVRPGDAVTIVGWGHRLYTRLPFTDDLTEMDAVLGKMSEERHYDVTGDREDIEREREWQGQVEAATGVSQGNMPVVSAGDAATREFSDMKAKSQAIRAVLESISGVEGQKVMLLVTRRFSRYAGREYLIARRATVGPPTDYERAFDTINFLEAITRTANANGVTLYPLYPEGLHSDWTESSANTFMPKSGDSSLAMRDYITLDNEVQALAFVADATGGQAAWGQADVIKLLPRIEQDLTSYYSLAYRATTTRTDRVRKIVVEAKNRDYTVRSRRQFIEKSDDTRMKDRVVATLFETSDDTKIPLRIRLGERRVKGKDRYVVPLSIEIPVQSLAALPDDKTNRGAFSVYVAWGDVLGFVSDVLHQTQPFTVADIQKAKNGHFTYDLDLLTDGKTNRVAVGVYDEVGKDYGLQRIDLPRPVPANQGARPEVR
jgi:VWFA-related protein